MKKTILVILAMTIFITGCSTKSESFITKISNVKKVEDKIAVRSVYVKELNSIYKDPDLKGTKYNYFEPEDIITFDKSVLATITTNEMYKSAETVKNYSEIKEKLNNVLAIAVLNWIKISADEGTNAVCEVSAVLTDSDKNIKFRKDFVCYSTDSDFNIGSMKTRIHKAIARKVLEELNSFTSGIPLKNEKYEECEFYNSISEVLPKLPVTLSKVHKGATDTKTFGNVSISHTPVSYIADIQWMQEIKIFTGGFDWKTVE